MWGLSWEGCALLPWLLLNEGWDVVTQFLHLARWCPAHAASHPVLAGAGVTQQGPAAMPRGTCQVETQFRAEMTHGKIF